MNSTSMKCLKALPGSGVSYTDVVCPCDVRSFGKNTKKAYPKTTSTSADTASELVRISLVSSIVATSTAKIGLRYASEFTDCHTRHREVYIPKNKSDALPFLQVFVKY